MSNLHISDEIFMPKADGEIDNGEMDEVEKELEEFKRLIKDLFINTCTHTGYQMTRPTNFIYFKSICIYTCSLYTRTKNSFQPNQHCLGIIVLSC